MNSILSLAIELNRDLMTTVRLTTGGVCSYAGLDIDETEDCKVCITESLLLLMHRGYPSARITFTEDAGMFVRIEAEGNTHNEREYPEDEISCALLSALAGDVNLEKENDCLRAIGFRFAKHGG